MPSHVTHIAPALAADALAHFAGLLAFETDCWDVWASLRADAADFVLIDVRSPALYAAGHVAGAINIPHARMIASRMGEFPADSVFVVYCAGPHCNGANKAAARLSRLGLAVKVMTGGITGWLDEGLELARPVAA